MQKLIANEILLAEVGRLLSEGKDVVLMTKGFSMNPFIRGGRDSVLLRRMSPESIAAGDIVLAEVVKDRYVLHRVVRVDGGRLTLMGDGNIVGQEHCGKENVLGTVLSIVRPSGRQVKPGKARLWRSFGPFVRRVLLALYRRTLLKI